MSLYKPEQTLTAYINMANQSAKNKDYDTAHQYMDNAISYIEAHPSLKQFMFQILELKERLEALKPTGSFGFRRSSKRSKSPRRRGRPKGSKNKRKSSKSKSKSRRKRGRPKGSKNKKSR